jgi:NADH-quinone oxidoreductase subunit A
VNSPETAPLWPLAVYAACVLGIVGVMVGASFLLGSRRRGEAATGEPYESGIVSQGSARLRFTARFYLMAILFVIFDLEAVFIFTWSVAVRDLGWTGYAALLVFILLLLAAWVYLWRSGALDWGPSRAGGARNSHGGIRSHEPTK